jgi:hypothetical protein
MLRQAHEMGAAPEFRRELETWVARLLSSEWEVVLGADDTLGDRASVSVSVRNHEATVMVCPTRDVRPNLTACHEIVHILLRRMRQFARDTWVEAHEEVTEEVARAFMRAYAIQTEAEETK